jgi:hypothetical protein
MGTLAFQAIQDALNQQADPKLPADGQPVPPALWSTAQPAQDQTQATDQTPANPFASMMANVQSTGFARPEAQQWMQQALGQQMGMGQTPQMGGVPAAGSQYLPGWGPAQGGSMSNAPGTTGGPSGGPVSGTPYTFSGDISQDAYKIKKQIKKMRNARGISLGDIAKIAGSAALTYATGGTAAAIAGSAGLAGLGAVAQGKAAVKNIHQYQKLKNQYLPDIGWTMTKHGGWADASGQQMSTAQIVQTLMNLGAFG